MRWTSWRRAVAVAAMLVGIGVGASTVPASAAPSHVTAHSTSSLADWWW
ncbi:MAG TPA: hypothetical protein VKB75_03870 [Jatrophihabitans sp.]|nr:hypothetical protein [Jatrophihabitans sp.]